MRRVVLAGCGEIANIWAADAVARHGVEVVGLVDVVPGAADKLAARHDIRAPTFIDVGEAIAHTDASLLLNVTTPSAHERVVTTALHAGCDVLGEKPMASSPAGVREILRAVEQTGRFHAVMQNRRYIPHMVAARDAVASGAVGRVGFVTADFFVGAHFSGFRNEMDSPLVVDMAVHTFDQARMLTGADAVWASCVEFNPPGSWYRGDAAAVCTFGMSNGSVFSYRGSWVSEGTTTPWEASWRLMGETGTVHWDGADALESATVDPDERRFVKRSESRPITAMPLRHTGHAGCLDEMYDALFTRRRSQTDCRDNANTMAMVFAAVESAAHGGARVDVGV